MSAIAKTYKISAKEFEKQYKNHLSGFNEWDQKETAENKIIFSENTGKYLSIDEIAVSNGELYTVLTNKQAHGKKGALITMCKGTKAVDIINILAKIPYKQRGLVKEVTLDMSGSMNMIIRESFPNATLVTDRFHVQKIVSEAVQEVRIDIRKQVIKSENEAYKKSKKENKKYYPVVYKNDDSKKQLLARSRYLLFKAKSKWTDSQKQRAGILFNEYPEIKNAYNLSMMFRSFYEHSKTIKEAKQKLDEWYKKVEGKNNLEDKYIEPFLIAADSIRIHEFKILNYFINRSTNASAESFNAKLKGFRALVRGVRDKKFFLFRIAKLYG